MKSLFLIILLCAGAVSAAPAQEVDRTEYTSSLNSMVSLIMNWYGSLIQSNDLISLATEDTEITAWNNYRSQYNKSITNIEIASTDLVKLNENNDYQFKIQTIIFNTGREGVQQRQELIERFMFNVPLLGRPSIKKINREQLKLTVSKGKNNSNSSYFKARQFSYAWLAYLDGVTTMTGFMDDNNWLEKASYSLKIGSLEITDSIAATLLNRHQYLAKGGHLLRSIDVQKNAILGDKLTLNLIIEWKGENASGKAVIAKIHQEIDIKILENNSWEVISIKEEHLLPDLKPWQGFLC